RRGLAPRRAGADPRRQVPRAEGGPARGVDRGRAAGRAARPAPPRAAELRGRGRIGGRRRRRAQPDRDAPAGRGVMSGATPVSLLIVDDSRGLVEVFTLTARLEPGIRVVGSLFSADRLVERIGELSPDVALVDLTMPGKDPLEAVREAAAAHPATRCLICSGYHDPERAAAV